jgi:hypothetical protein
MLAYAALTHAPLWLATLVAIGAAVALLPRRRIIPAILVGVLALQVAMGVASMAAQAGMIYASAELQMSYNSLGPVYGLAKIISKVGVLLLHCGLLVAIFGFRTPLPADED